MHAVGSMDIILLCTNILMLLLIHLHLLLCRFNDIILARVFSHNDINELSKHATVPVINALSDLHHPLQTLADLMALEDHFGDLRGKTLAWVGDGNNVLHDLMLGGAKLGMNIRIATPVGYEANADILETTRRLGSENGTKDVFTTTVASEAVQGSDVVVTDTWVSMGQECHVDETSQSWCCLFALLAPSSGGG
jgi:ornithine carbamoyltransferase